MTKDISLRGASRRDFIKSVVSAGAVLGLGPAHALDTLYEMGGSVLADEACSSAARSVHVVAGNGGFSWFTLLWPVPQVIVEKKSGFSYDDYAKVGPVAGTEPGHPLYSRLVDGKPLWDRFGSRKRVTCVMSGRDQTHTVAPDSGTIISGGVGGSIQSFAAAGALQSPLQALVSVINMRRTGTPMPYGPAPGAPPPALVGSAEELVGLFSSSAARLADRLASPDNRLLFEQFEKAFLSIQRTANRPTYQRAYRDANTAVALLSQNVGDVLRPDRAKLLTWCPGFDIDADPELPANRVLQLARTLLVTANAFRLGLVGQIIIPAFNDDPHRAFDEGRVPRTADCLARVLHSFMEELASIDDPLCRGKGKSVADNVVMTFSGDTPKNPFNNSGGADWQDGAPGNSNWMYVMSNGYMRAGWFGQVTTGGRRNFDPRTGQADTGTAMVPEADSTAAAQAALLYSIVKGNDRLVRQFYTGEYGGLLIPPIG